MWKEEKEEDKFGSDKTGWLPPFAYQEYSQIGIQFNVKPFTIPPRKLHFMKVFFSIKKPLNASHYKHWPIVVPAPFLVSARGKEIKMGELSF